MLCASIGNTECLSVILSLGPQINSVDKFCRSALHFACQRGDKDIFSLLVQVEGIDVDLQTVAGITPLMMAANNGNIYLMQECLNANMNPFLKDGLNQTAYDYV